MNKTLTLLSSLALLATAVALVPNASAHECFSLVPGGAGCGACLPVDEEHDHRTVGNVKWCSSSPPCEDTVARTTLLDCSALPTIFIES